MSVDDSTDKPNKTETPKEEFPEVMTVAEAARYLQLADQVLYRHIRAGTVPASRLGKTIRFKKSVLDAWLEESAWKTVGRIPPKKTPKPTKKRAKASAWKISERPDQPSKKTPRRRRPPNRDFRVDLD